jgi:hypothetical protein
MVQDLLDFAMLKARNGLHISELMYEACGKSEDE